jgi:diadenosine tetraphosphate (Ap4A) HIT family hydrolase
MFKLSFLFIFASALLFGEECPFCNKEIIQKQEVHRSRYWHILVDYRPILPGHLLLVPIAHRPTRHSLTLEEQIDLYNIEKRVHHAILNHFGALSEDLQFEKNGPTFQSVHHFHIHVLPISKEQGSFWGRIQLAWRLFMPPPQLSDEQLAQEKAQFSLLFPPSEMPHAKPR